LISKEPPPKRIRLDTQVGILGGTFNPPHIAHLIVAETVRDHLKLDKILFVPASVPPHKLNVEIIPAAKRLQMVKLAVKGNPFFEASDMELRRKGPSFTIDTLVDLKRERPSCDLYFLLGIDLLREFDTWKNPEMVLEECRVVAMNRPGFDLASVKEDLLRRIEVVMVPSVDISSTDIRRRVKSGRSIRYLVPDDVENFIHENSIYM